MQACDQVLEAISDFRPDRDYYNISHKYVDIVRIISTCVEPVSLTLLLGRHLSTAHTNMYMQYLINFRSAPSGNLQHSVHM